MRLAPVSVNRITTLLLLAWLAPAANAGGVTVAVFDRDGQAVADVAVYAVRRDGAVHPLPPGTRAVMDQRDKQFVPHLLVVQTGTSVEFPNSDAFAHHVYSFSHPNKFMLPMYKGQAHPPVTFEHSGIVTLGCNIHDHMLGYILVVDSPIFSKTDANGRASLTLNQPEQYEIRIWSPRIRDGDELLSRTVVEDGEAAAEVSFRLAKKLNPPHGAAAESETWSEY